jgi:hypothetical protein
MANNLKAYEIRFRNSPRGKVQTVTQFHESADGAHFDGMRSIQQYEPRASFISVREVPDPRGQVEEAPAPGFWVRDAETGEWEQI